MNVISFTKVSLPYGWLGNMSPHPVTYRDKEYRTTEALFQSLRFKRYPEAQEEIRIQKSPMAAKMVAKKYKHLLTPEDYKDDLRYMKICLLLKLLYHPKLINMLIETNDSIIIEDVTRRPRGNNLFWGAALIDGKWVGENALGLLWMEIREILRK